MTEILKSVIAAIGIDIGKNSFHVVGLDGRGAIALRQKMCCLAMKARDDQLSLCRSFPSLPPGPEPVCD